MYKKDLAINNVQRLICSKTKPNQTKSYIFNVCVLNGLTLNTVQRLIFNKTKPNQILYI